MKIIYYFIDSDKDKTYASENREALEKLAIDKASTYLLEFTQNHNPELANSIESELKELLETDYAIYEAELVE